MNFVMKKKKHKFDVELTLEELTNVAVVNAVLFAKVRLLGGGSFSAKSSSEDVVEHKVKWGAKLSFQCKISAHPQTNLLDTCRCRISIRKETRGGKSYDKLGFVDVNLSEFAGAGKCTKTCLLEGYSERNRQDNSTLRISVCLNLVSLDPCFKTPGPRPDTPPEQGVEEPPETPVTTPEEQVANLNMADYPNMTKRMQGTTAITSSEYEMNLAADVEDDFKKGHSRHSSNSSHMSKGSGYGSLSQHSRQSSSGDSTLIRSTSSGTCSGQSDTGTFEKHNKRKKNPGDETKDSRMTDTRVNNDEVIDELIEKCGKLQNVEEDPADNPGLQLYVGSDGTHAFSAHESAGGLQHVVISNR